MVYLQGQKPCLQPVHTHRDIQPVVLKQVLLARTQGQQEKIALEVFPREFRVALVIARTDAASPRRRY